MRYKSYSLHNFRQIPQIERLSEEQKFIIQVVGTVLPFKTSNYVVDELINWDNFEKDPFFILTFPQKDMLTPKHFNQVANLIEEGAPRNAIRKVVDEIRLELNPNPAGQESNVPELDGVRLSGIQHKYRQTMLFFPSQGQTCHAYCTFCFRWPQFGHSDFKFAMKEADLMVKYLKSNPNITDVLFTGGDPMVMKTKTFEYYFNAILDANISHLRTIRIGTKALTYWPYRFTTDEDSGELLQLFKKVKARGINISLMAHVNHPDELNTLAVREAIGNLLDAGVQIRSQSPILRNINDNSTLWTRKWKLEVKLGITPYYMFIPRETGAQNYFAVTLERAWNIFRWSYSHVSGICRTVRGPSMSCIPGKIQIVGISEVHGEKVFVLNFLQGRNHAWVGKPFFAKYDPDAIWISDLKPAFGEKYFFYADELFRIMN